MDPIKLDETITQLEEEVSKVASINETYVQVEALKKEVIAEQEIMKRNEATLIDAKGSLNQAVADLERIKNAFNIQLENTENKLGEKIENLQGFIRDKSNETRKESRENLIKVKEETFEMICETRADLKEEISSSSQLFSDNLDKASKSLTEELSEKAEELNKSITEVEAKIAKNNEEIKTLESKVTMLEQKMMERFAKSQQIQIITLAGVVITLVACVVLNFV